MCRLGELRALAFDLLSISYVSDPNHGRAPSWPTPAGRSKKDGQVVDCIIIHPRKTRP